MLINTRNKILKRLCCKKSHSKFKLEIILLRGKISHQGFLKGTSPRELTGGLLRNKTFRDDDDEGKDDGHEVY